MSILAQRSIRLILQLQESKRNSVCFVLAVGTVFGKNWRKTDLFRTFTKLLEALIFKKNSY
jgi:hypothetical protein